jgi:hypothetical protein
VAPTGFGKDRAVDVLPQLAHAIGSRVVGPQNFASGSALECLLRTEPWQVLPLDELDMFFKASDRFSESHSQAKIKAIVDLFSRSAGVWVAKVRAGDAEKNGKIVSQPIHFPTLSLLGATTPSTLYEGLHEDAFKSGLIPRWLVISVEDEPPIKNIEGRPRVPVTLVTQLPETLTSSGAEALSGLARAFFYAGARALLVSQAGGIVASTAYHQLPDDAGGLVGQCYSRQLGWLALEKVDQPGLGMFSSPS